jgi:hypothetical protein
MTNRTPSSSTCPSCGARASGKFCNQCGAALAVGGCGSCGSALPAGARFCNECGASVSAAGGGAVPPGGAPRPAASGVSTYAPWVVATVLLFSVVGYFAGRGTGGGSAAATPADGAGIVAPFANGASGPAPDISNMTPRERAGRLYDRIMRYVEEGKKDSAQFFAPMALSSFEMLGAELDLDARYDYGRVASETGNFDVAAAQADTILAKSPNHLLGLALAARTATSRGEAASAARSWKTFLSVKDAEMKKNLPEYQAHATDIEQATRMAQGAK